MLHSPSSHFLLPTNMFPTHFFWQVLQRILSPMQFRPRSLKPKSLQGGIGPCCPHWGQRGSYPAGKLRVFWEILNKIPTLYPAGKLRVFLKKPTTLIILCPVGKLRVHSRNTHHFAHQAHCKQNLWVLSQFWSILTHVSFTKCLMGKHWSKLWKNP